MKPIEHAKSSAKAFGGKPEDYLAIHELMDSSKAAMGDLRHRALTHNSWFVTTILEKIFGPSLVIKGERGTSVVVSVRDIGEQHILEDFRGKYIPSAQDYLCEMEMKEWMDNGNGEAPPSQKKNNLRRKPRKGRARKLSPLEEAIRSMQEYKEEQDRRPHSACGGAGMLD